MWHRRQCLALVLLPALGVTLEETAPPSAHVAAGPVNAEVDTEGYRVVGGPRAKCGHPRMATARSTPDPRLRHLALRRCSQSPWLRAGSPGLTLTT